MAATGSALAINALCWRRWEGARERVAPSSLTLWRRVSPRALRFARDSLRWREMDSNFRFRARRNQEIQVSRRSSTDLVYGIVARISAEPSGRHAREQY